MFQCLPVVTTNMAGHLLSSFFSYGQTSNEARRPSREGRDAGLKLARAVMSTVTCHVAHYIMNTCRMAVLLFSALHNAWLGPKIAGFTQ